MAISTEKLQRSRYGTPPAVAIARHFWQRHQLGISLFVAYGFTMVAVAHGAVPGLSAPTVYMMSLPCAFGILYLMGIFTHSDADVISQDAGYPSYLLTLPVSTRTLVFWPMVFGSIAVSLAWMLPAEFIINARGADIPIVWPAVMLASITNVLQAIFWSPTPFKYHRLIAVLTIVPGVVAFSPFALQRGLPWTAIATVYLTLIPCAFAVAFQGVARARRGDPAVFDIGRLLTAVEGIIAAATPAKRQKFRSASAAHFWLEWRQHGLMLPMLVGGVCLCFTLPLFQVHDLVPFGSIAYAGGMVEIHLNSYLKTYLLNLWPAPPLIAAVIGCGTGRSDDKKSERVLSLFIATRPVSDLGLVTSKWLVSFASCIAAWSIMALFVFVWLLTPARFGTVQTNLIWVITRSFSIERAFYALPALILMIAWTWRSQVIGLFAALSDHKWLNLGYAAVVNASLLSAFVLGVQWMAVPDSAPSLHALKSAAPIAVTILVTGKLLCAAAVLHVLLRKKVVTGSQIIGFVLIWTAAVVALFATLCHLTSLDIFSSLPIPSLLRTTPSLLTLAVLSVPLSRLACAPLTLSLSRHK